MGKKNSFLSKLGRLKLIFVIMVTIKLPGCTGQGRMIEPPMRSSMWRYDFNTPKNYQDDLLNCGGYQRYIANNESCGTCGDPHDGIRHNEAGGQYATGTVGRYFSLSDTHIPVTIELTGNYGGKFEFRLCPHNNVNEPVTQVCLDRYPLIIEEGVSHGTPYAFEPKTIGIYNLTIQIPDGMFCTQCVLQWKYRAEHRLEIRPKKTDCIGCNYTENFQNCADVSIGYYPEILPNVPPTTPSDHWTDLIKHLLQPDGYNFNPNGAKNIQPFTKHNTNMSSILRASIPPPPFPIISNSSTREAKSAQLFKIPPPPQTLFSEHSRVDAIIINTPKDTSLQHSHIDSTIPLNHPHLLQSLHIDVVQHHSNSEISALSKQNNISSKNSSVSKISHGLHQEAFTTKTQELNLDKRIADKNDTNMSSILRASIPPPPFPIIFNSSTREAKSAQLFKIPPPPQTLFSEHSRVDAIIINTPKDTSLQHSHIDSTIILNHPHLLQSLHIDVVQHHSNSEISALSKQNNTSSKNSSVSKISHGLHQEAFTTKTQELNLDKRIADNNDTNMSSILRASIPPPPFPIIFNSSTGEAKSAQLFKIPPPPQTLFSEHSRVDAIIINTPKDTSLQHSHIDSTIPLNHPHLLQSLHIDVVQHHSNSEISALSKQNNISSKNSSVSKISHGLHQEAFTTKTQELNLDKRIADKNDTNMSSILRASIPPPPFPIIFNSSTREAKSAQLFKIPPPPQTLFSEHSRVDAIIINTPKDTSLQHSHIDSTIILNHPHLLQSLHIDVVQHHSNSEISALSKQNNTSSKNSSVSKISHGLHQEAFTTKTQELNLDKRIADKNNTNMSSILRASIPPPPFPIIFNSSTGEAKSAQLFKIPPPPQTLFSEHSRVDAIIINTPKDTSLQHSHIDSTIPLNHPHLLQSLHIDVVQHHSNSEISALSKQNNTSSKNSSVSEISHGLQQETFTTKTQELNLDKRIADNFQQSLSQALGAQSSSDIMLVSSSTVIDSKQDRTNISKAMLNEIEARIAIAELVLADQLIAQEAWENNTAHIKNDLKALKTKVVSLEDKLKKLENKLGKVATDVTKVKPLTSPVKSSRKEVFRRIGLDLPIPKEEITIATTPTWDIKERIIMGKALEFSKNVSKDKNMISKAQQIILEKVIKDLASNINSVSQNESIPEATTTANIDTWKTTPRPNVAHIGREDPAEAMSLDIRTARLLVPLRQSAVKLSDKQEPQTSQSDSHPNPSTLQSAHFLDQKPPAESFPFRSSMASVNALDLRRSIIDVTNTGRLMAESPVLHQPVQGSNSPRLNINHIQNMGIQAAQGGVDIQNRDNLDLQRDRNSARRSSGDRLLPFGSSGSTTLSSRARVMTGSSVQRTAEQVNAIPDKIIGAVSVSPLGTPDLRARPQWQMIRSAQDVIDLRSSIENIAANNMQNLAPSMGSFPNSGITSSSATQSNALFSRGSNQQSQQQREQIHAQQQHSQQHAQQQVQRSSASLHSDFVNTATNGAGQIQIPLVRTFQPRAFVTNGQMIPFLPVQNRFVNQQFGAINTNSPGTINSQSQHSNVASMQPITFFRTAGFLSG